MRRTTSAPQRNERSPAATVLDPMVAGVERMLMPNWTRAAADEIGAVLDFNAPLPTNKELAEIIARAYETRRQPRRP